MEALPTQDSTTNHVHDNHAPNRRRASQACQHCRKRKVRCDITLRGTPCTNCRMDRTECSVIASRRGPKPRTGLTAPVNTTHDAERQQRRHQQRSPSQRATPLGHEPYTPVSSTSQRPFEGVPCLEGSSNEVASSRSPLRSGSIHEVAAGLTFEPDDEAVALLSSRHMSSEPDVDREMTDRTWAYGQGDHRGERMPYPPTLPEFLSPLPSSILPDDLAFLAHKGALRLPEPALRDAILQAYAHAVYPFMPVLDLKYFLDAISSNGATGRVSLLLFQAVMFAGSSVVDKKVLRQYSFDSAKHARQVFFPRVRLLHDFAVESNQQVLMQSLLLMSLWYGGPDDQRTTWYYAGLACSTAYSIGLHRAPAPTDPHAKLRRRLFWSLYIRDRLIALATRRPMLIRDDEYTVPMLSSTDFARHDYSSMATPGLEPAALEIEPGICLPLMCIELAKLCVLAGRILQTFYTTLGHRNRWTEALMVIPKEDLDTNNIAISLELYNDEISGWYDSMHPTVCNVRKIPFNRRSEPIQNCLQQHWELIDMLRLTVVTLLYRPQGFRTLSASASCTAELIELRRTSRKKLRAAARGLTLIGSNAMLQGRVRFLTTSAIPAFLSAGLTHLLDVDSSDEDRRDAATFRFSQIVQVFRGLRNVYASADSSIQFLGRVVRKTGISARHPQISALATEFQCASSGSRVPTVPTTADQPAQQSSAEDNASPIKADTGGVSSVESRSGTLSSTYNAEEHANMSIEESSANLAETEQYRDENGDMDLFSLFGPPLGSCVSLDYDLDSFALDTGSLAWFDEPFDQQPGF